MDEVKEFTGILKFTSPLAKCGPLHILGHWVLKDIGKPWLVWCNDGIYKQGINANYCEIERIFTLKPNKTPQGVAGSRKNMNGGKRV